MDSEDALVQILISFKKNTEEEKKGQKRERCDNYEQTFQIKIRCVNNISTKKDLTTMPRIKRQQLYCNILKETGKVMTPSEMKEELEKRGMTFRFVGQDMSAMRDKKKWPDINIPSRGKYAWNDN